MRYDDIKHSQCRLDFDQGFHVCIPHMCSINEKHKGSYRLFKINSKHAWHIFLFLQPRSLMMTTTTTIIIINFEFNRSIIDASSDLICNFYWIKVVFTIYFRIWTGRCNALWKYNHNMNIIFHLQSKKNGVIQWTTVRKIHV